MSSPKVIILYFKREMAKLLQEELPGVEVEQFTRPLSDSALEEKLALLSEAEIIFGTPSWMTNVIPRCTNLKWIQSITAGVDSVIKEVTEHKVNADIILTRNGETFVQPMSEHIITLILACNKGLYKCHEQQKQAIFQRRNILAKPLALSSVGILGLGCIGRETARICKAFGTKVWGMTRTTVSEDSKCPNVDEYRTMSDLHEILSECDYIVNILPSTAETRGILSGEVFSHCKMGATFINVGRGDVTDEESVIKALRNKWLQYAALDVHIPEPLPASSPLWSEPGVIITPHMSGGYVGTKNYEQHRAKMFMKQYRRFINNEPLEYVVDLNRGY
ncbi:glyoxylate/hydroxypyruvate reductase A-like isoform X2 [Haliotis rubra]|uniref:glyoxylate/hydroxypyruvate reductase A-like isoform X2 n=1 Tax=Haliotis rubra TaxID=36100 RepID=UPI001EE54C07|nr:glyoxylate/hydroxypyruvate reductase A-like isoform X2 [Haliotis rubra]